MIKNIYKVFGLGIYLLTSSTGFSYDPRKLDDLSSAINEFIWTKRSISAEFVQNSLDFLNSEDVEVIEKNRNFQLLNIKNKIEKKIIFDEACDGNLLNFLNACVEVYEVYNDLGNLGDIYHAAVQTLFDKVFEKYQKHASYLTEEASILKSVKTPQDTSSKGRQIFQGTVSPKCKMLNPDHSMSPSFHGAYAH